MNDCIRLHSNGITHHHRPQSGLTEFLLPCHKSVSRSVLRAILEYRELGQTLGFDDISESDTGKKKKNLEENSNYNQCGEINPYSLSETRTHAAHFHQP